MKKLQRGFAIPIIIAIVALLAIGGGVYFYTNKKAEAPENKTGLSARQQIEELLVQDFGQPLYGGQMVIQKENDNYVVGQASVGEGGILVMAAKVDGKWTLVYTGNAFANCEDLSRYNFPKDFRPTYCN